MKVLTKADIELVCDMLRRCQDMNDFINENQFGEVSEQHLWWLQEGSGVTSVSDWLLDLLKDEGGSPEGGTRKQVCERAMSEHPNFFPDLPTAHDAFARLRKQYRPP
jgi:hypothetical protein